MTCNASFTNVSRIKFHHPAIPQSRLSRRAFVRFFGHANSRERVHRLRNCASRVARLRIADDLSDHFCFVILHASRSLTEFSKVIVNFFAECAAVFSSSPRRARGEFRVRLIREAEIKRYFYVAHTTPRATR